MSSSYFKEYLHTYDKFSVISSKEYIIAFHSLDKRDEKSATQRYT